MNGKVAHPLFDLNGRFRQLLVDVSDLACADRATGIQRVAKSILGVWIPNPPLGFRVEPVYLTPGAKGYRYARSLRGRFAEDETVGSDQDYVIYGNSDIFLGLDLLSLNPALICEQTRRYFKVLKSKGVNVRFAVHDILPLQFPEYFPKGKHNNIFSNWLELVSEGTGAVCVSHAVSLDLKSWLSKVGWLRPDFIISHFHHGADLESTAISMGIPEDSKYLLAELKMRPSFLVVGTIEPRKGHRQMLDAVDWIWAQGVDVNLVFVGQKGWMVDALVERMLQHPEKGRRFFWLDSISDEYLLKVYGNVTCLVASSEGEGFGLPTVEAVRSNLPIIARDLAVNREICGEFASYFSTDTPASLGAFLGQWLNNWRNGSLPDSSKIRLLTWHESASELFSACMSR